MCVCVCVCVCVRVCACVCACMPIYVYIILYINVQRCEYVDVGSKHTFKISFLLNYCSVVYKSRVSDQNGVSLLYIMLEIHHSGREPSSYRCM